MTYFMWRPTGRSLTLGGEGIGGQKTWPMAARSSPSCWKVPTLSATFGFRLTGKNIKPRYHFANTEICPKFNISPNNLQDASALQINESVSNCTREAAVLVYNRVPKTGSSTVLQIVSKLSKLKRFSLQRIYDYTSRSMTTSKETTHHDT